MLLLVLFAVCAPCAFAGFPERSEPEGEFAELAMRLPLNMIDCPPDHNKTIADPDVCRVYYHCIAQYPWPRQCPKDQHFKPIALGTECLFNMCVNPEDSGCVDSVNAEEKYQQLLPYLEEQEALIKKEEVQDEDDMEVAIQENSSALYPCYRDTDGNWVDKTLPNFDNCHQYYHCHEGIAWVDECPPFMYYTPKITWLGPLEDCNFVTCVMFEDAKCAIHGGWSEWGEWGNCSVPCGDGAQIRRRVCDNPPPVNGGEFCPGYDFEPRLCNEGECAENKTMVFVAMLVDIAAGTTPVDPLPFQSVIVNVNNGFDVGGNSFTAPTTGNYFMAINAGALFQQPLTMTLAGSGVAPIGNNRLHQNHFGRDSLNSNNILPLTAGDQVRIVLGAEGTLAADAGKPTSWAIFNVDEISVPVSLFSYAFDTPNDNPTIPLMFDVQVADVNGGYNPATGIFTANEAGIWVLMYGAGVNSSTVDTPIDFTLGCNTGCGNSFVQTKINRAHTTYKGVDTVSRLVIQELPQGAQVQVSTTEPYWSSAGLHVSFSGFFFNPMVVEDRISWFVVRTQDWNDALPLDPVNFQRTVVNQGGGWGAEVSHYYTVPINGYYLVVLSAGALSGTRVDYRLHQNDDYIFDIYRQSLVHSGVDTISRTAIFYFAAGDRLRLRAIGNSGLASAIDGYETSFGGVLLAAGNSTYSANYAHEVAKKEFAHNAGNMFEEFKLKLDGEE